MTALLLISTQLVKAGNKKIPFLDAFLMGIAQAAAVIPGISRSGATISTGLLLKNGRSDVAKFSFLMVLIPIIGAALLDILSMSSSTVQSEIPVLSLIIGFIAAYVSGFLACRWMISLVKKGNLYWFALYCAIIGNRFNCVDLINGFRNPETYLEGAVLLIDKPLTWTSFDVVNKIRKSLRHHLGNTKDQGRACRNPGSSGNRTGNHLYRKGHQAN